MSNAPMPAEKSTVEIEQVPAWAVKLTERVVSLRVDVCDHLHDIREQVTALTANSRRNSDEISAINEWRRSNSDRVKDVAKQASNNDLAHDARLADEIVARQALASDLAKAKEDLAQTKDDVAETKKETLAQTQILIDTAADVRKFLATPTVKIIGGLIFGAVTSYLATHYGVILK